MFVTGKIFLRRALVQAVLLCSIICWALCTEKVIILNAPLNSFSSEVLNNQFTIQFADEAYSIHIEKKKLY